jgi:hypothetical protein
MECRSCGAWHTQPERRAHRWIARRARGQLTDAAPGGSPMHGLLAEEVDQVLALFEEWGETDRSHRKLAHRGSYLHRVWVSPHRCAGFFSLPTGTFGHGHVQPSRRAGRSRLGHLHTELDLDLRHDTLPSGGYGGAHHRGPGLPQVDHRDRRSGCSAYGPSSSRRRARSAARPLCVLPWMRRHSHTTPSRSRSRYQKYSMSLPK